MDRIELLGEEVLKAETPDCLFEKTKEIGEIVGTAVRLSGRAMQKSLGLILLISCLALKPACAQYPPYDIHVTSISVGGSPTDGVMVPVTITIYRDPREGGADLIVGNCSGIATNFRGYTYDPTGGTCGPTWPPGSNTWTGNVGFQGTVKPETVQLFAQVAYSCQGTFCGVGYNLVPDPGTSVPVTITPDTLSATISPSVVPPSGSNPLLNVTVTNGNGTILHYAGGPSAVWNCTDTLPTSWVYTLPNVSYQTQLPLLQPPDTQTCDVTVGWTAWDGQVSVAPSVTYQANPSSADLGPSCPRSGGENMCGSPINLTNGNVWTQATDYTNPGLGGGISLTRTWNSQWRSYSPWVLAGMFGDGWQSNLEKHIQLLSGGKQVLYWRGDGSAWSFTLNKGAWTLASPADERATLVSSKTSYILTLRDGSVELYNLNGFLTAVQDRNGNQTSITYDGSNYNRISTVTGPGGQVLQFNYANSLLPAQVTSIQDSLGTYATYSYDSGSHLLSVSYADGSGTINTYDANGLLLSVTDPQNKLIESHTYDHLRRGLSSQRANGVDALTVDYTGVGTAGATVSTSTNYYTSYAASTRIGNRYYVTQILGPGCSSCVGRNNQVFYYDGSGNRISSQDANGNSTNFTFDSNGNVTQVSRPSSSGTQVWKYTWNGFGEVLTATDPLTKVTTNTYDTKGNVLTIKTSLGNTTTFTYDTKGELLTIKDPRLNITTLTYNSAGLVASIKDAQNNLTQLQYDARGNRTAVIDALNQTTSYTYDSMNRLTKITYPTSPATSVQFGYDYRGRRSSVTDANGKITQYAYDDADRLTSVTDANNQVTGYAYDNENNLTQITDAALNKTLFNYDALGRVTQTTFPSNLTEIYGYDSNGNLITKKDRNGNTINYAYDAANRLTSKTYPDNGTVSYTFDLASHLTQVVDATGTYGFTFDADGRLTQASTAYAFIPGKNFTIGYGYDGAANRTSMTDPQNAGTTYVYDSLNRLSSLTSPQGAFGFSYDALNRRAQLTRPNNVTTIYGYDPVSRLLSVLHKSGATTLDGVTYTLDNAGNRISRTPQPSGTATNFGYDNIYQLLSAQGASANESYTYDPAGNRLTSSGGSYGYNASTELTSSPTATYTYDNNGNTLTKTDSTGSTSYAWDFENRLTGITLPASGGTLSFRYDALGRRVQKSFTQNSTTTTTSYVYDDPNLLEEVDTSGNVVARYTQTQSMDEPLAMLRAGVTNFYHADGIGSVTSLSNASGSLVQTYVYDSFGNQTSSSGSVTNPFRYSAREFDAESNLHFYRARYYDPSSGRFLSEDPLRFKAGPNLYAYVRNNPVRHRDALGLCPTPCSSLSLDDPSSFWDDSFATPEQIDSFLQSTNAPGSWDGYDAAQAFIDQGINPGLAVGIMGAETSMGNGNLSARNIRDPFSSGGADFSNSLRRGLGVVTKLEDATSSDPTPLTALIDQNNTLNQAYEGDDWATRKAWVDHVNSWYRKLAKFLGLCQ